MIVTAVIQLKPREIRRTTNKERQYSPVLSSERPMAPKASTAIAVEPSSGIAVCETTSFAACILSLTPLHRDEHAFGDDDGIVHQHHEGDDEGAE